MRISAPNPAVPTAAPANSRRAGGTGFSVSEPESSRPGNGPAVLRTVGGIEALMALQGSDEPLERRRRAVRRGTSALDALEELKLGLLSGDCGPATLSRLNAAATGLKEDSGDAKLDAVMAEIDLRLAVELAKLSPGG